MLTPYLMAKNMFDELAESAFGANTLRGMMNTDIKESDQGYELDIDLPGVHKENLSAELKDGILRLFIPKVSQMVHSAVWRLDKNKENRVLSDPVLSVFR